MKKTLITIIGLFMIFSLVSTVSAETISIGNDDTSRTVTDTRANFVIIDTNNPASSNAWLDSIKYYASSTNDFHFLIVDTDDQVRWVSKVVTPSTTPGSNQHTLDPHVFIKAGWNIGMYFISTGTIPFEYAGNPAWYTRGGYGLPNVGDTLTFQSSSNRIYSFVAGGTKLPYGVIVSPDENEKIIGTFDLEAEYYDGYADDEDGVYWAVRYNTCDTATDTVFGNVDNHNDSYSWDGINFSATIDTSTVAPGHYCFIFNPQDDVGEADVRETRWFYIAEGNVHGGGQLIQEIESAEAPDGQKNKKDQKSKDDLKISFGGQIWDLGPAGIMGEWEVNFHNVGNDDLDQTKFHTSEITYIQFYTGNSETCDDAVRFNAFGKWNGKDGYKMIFRAGDLGNKNTADTVRVELFDPEGESVYDTHSKSEFTDKSSCVGSARTGLDHGNITIWH